jgi:TetR/AcrR family transcriptional regulator of autoinduction and epiphytic fitness
VKVGTKDQLLDAAQRILVEEGYAAVTTRRIAQRLGVSFQLVHYYFKTMDELLLALVRRSADLYLVELGKALFSNDPLQALWKLFANPARAKLAYEVLAMGNHRKAIAAELTVQTQRMRDLETSALERFLEQRGVDSRAYPADGVAFLVAAVARTMGMEEATGVSRGHRNAVAIAEKLMASLTADPETPARSSDEGNVLQPARSAARTRRSPTGASRRRGRASQS